MKNNTIKWIFLLCFWLVALNSANASDSKSLFQTANTYYKNKQYEEAEKIYTLLIKQDKKNANAYYNLGNTNYHLKHYVYAVLYYEKAKKLQPDNKYITRNLELTNNKLFSKIEFSKEFFVTKQLKNIAHTQTSRKWSIWMLAALWIGAIVLCIHFFTGNKYLFRLGALACIASISLSFFTYAAYKSEHQQNYAIVIEQNAYMKSTPVETMNAAQAVLAGLKVEIIDTDKNWWKIKLPNDKTGWIKRSSLELI